MFAAKKQSNIRVPAEDLPLSNRHASQMQGHWLLARLGKRVLRPGGLRLTRELLGSVSLNGQRVVELAPGMGKTAALIMEHEPSSYIGVDSDPQAAAVVERVVAARGTVVVADAASTGLPETSADVILGEAMLTLQGDKSKRAIVAEASRVLAVGGRYAIHELALQPDTVEASIAEDVRTSLVAAIRVNARPLTIAQWKALLADAGLEVTQVRTAPMALLQPRRLIADEGLLGALRFFKNLLRDKEARQRVMLMRGTFAKHRKSLIAVGIIATKHG